jgi:hypothetical protein
MKLKLETTRTLDGHLRSLVQSRDNSIVCAGGRDPINGQRSAFLARVSSFSLPGLEPEWDYTIEKSKPFSSIALCGEMVVAGIDQNFDRTPCGFWGVAVEGGELVTSKQLPNSFLVSSANNVLMTATPDFEREIATIAECYPAETAIAKIASTETESLVGITACLGPKKEQQCIATIQVAGRKSVTYQHSLFRRGTKKPLWEISSKNVRLFCDGGSVVSYSSEKQRELEVWDLSTGEMAQRVKFSSEGVHQLAKIDKDVFVMSSGDRNLVLFSGQNGILDSVQLKTEHPGWLDFCVCSGGQHIVALSTENNRGMKSHLSFFDTPR